MFSVRISIVVAILCAFCPGIPKLTLRETPLKVHSAPLNFDKLHGLVLLNIQNLKIKEILFEVSFACLEFPTFVYDPRYSTRMLGRAFCRNLSKILSKSFH